MSTTDEEIDYNIIDEAEEFDDFADDLPGLDDLDIEDDFSDEI